jgi:hypothetical protein
LRKKLLSIVGLSAVLFVAIILVDRERGSIHWVPDILVTLGIAGICVWMLKTGKGKK